MCSTGAPASRSFRSRKSPAPGGAIPEDRTAPTQPISDLTFTPQPLQEKDMWGVTHVRPAGLPHRVPPLQL